MKRCLAVLALAFISVSIQRVSAQDLSPIPLTNSYESLAVGTSIITNETPGVGRWVGTEGSAAIVTNVSYLAGVSYPLSSETHTNIMVFSGEVVNSFETNAPLENVWIDTMIQPVFSETPPMTPSVTNSQLSICFISTNGTDGSLSLYHGIVTNLAEDRVWEVQADTNLWYTFTTPQVVSGQWIRLSVELKYYNAVYDRSKPSFRLLLDGVPLTNEWGFADENFTSQPGSWFRCTTATKLNLNDLALTGTGGLDDLIVSDSAPTFYSTAAANGVPYEWLAANGLSTNNYPEETWDDLASGDRDDDGMSTWAEWVAGTHPTNPLSFLQIVSQTISNGAPVLTWLSSTSALSPYTFEISTNLLDPNAWSLLPTNVPATVQGTETLTAPVPDVTPAFYRITIIP